MSREHEGYRPYSGEPKLLYDLEHLLALVRCEVGSKSCDDRSHGADNAATIADLLECSRFRRDRHSTAGIERDDMALGARRSRVLQMMMGESLKLVGIGMLFRIPDAWIGARAIKAMLFGVSPLDPFLLASAALVICVIALLAACYPAMRASKIDPGTALRCE